MKKILLSLSLLFTVSSIFSQVNHWEMVASTNETWSYIVPTSNENFAWFESSYNDSAWSKGVGGFGKNDGDDNTTISADTSFFLRKKFNIVDIDDITSAYFCMDYDDGFAAYINGTLIASAGLTNTPANYNDFANSSHEANLYQGGTIDYFKVDITTLTSCLTNGINIIAIQVHNSNSTSSDMSAIPYLMCGIKSTATNYSSTPNWFEITEINLDSTNMPIVIINTEDGAAIPYDENIEYPKIKASMKVINNASGINYITDTATDYNGNIGIETRGNYSAQFDQKPYGIETRDSAGENLNVVLMEMPAENDWVMINNQYDKTFIRHSLAYQIFRDMGYYAPRTKLCEVILNDEYQGIYLFGEKIKQDKGRVEIATLNETDTVGDELTGGYIFKVDYPGDDDYWTSKIDRSERGISNNINFIYHDPKKEDLTTTQSNYLQDYIDGFESVLFGDDFDNLTTGYRSYVNVESFIDYMLLNELCHNIDAYKKSKYYFKDKDSKGGLINSGPAWDYDWAWRDYGYSFVSGKGWAFGYYNSEYVPDLWINRMMEDQYFKNQISKRYYSLRETLFSVDYINAYIDSVATYVDAAKDRHFKKWDLLGKVIGYQGSLPVGDTYAEEVANMKSWINKRVTFLDSEFSDFYVPGYDINSTDYVAAKIRIFPNPASNYVYVEGHTLIEEVILYNISGTEVLKKSTNEEFTIMLDISHLNSDIYIIQIKTVDGIVTTGKLIKN